MPLLGQGYAPWSRETLERLRQPPRAEACAAFLEQLATFDPNAPEDDTEIRELHRLYREGLMACRTRYGLQMTPLSTGTDGFYVSLLRRVG